MKKFILIFLALLSFSCSPQHLPGHCLDFEGKYTTVNINDMVNAEEESRAKRKKFFNTYGDPAEFAKSLYKSHAPYKKQIMDEYGEFILNYMITLGETNEQVIEYILIEQQVNPLNASFDDFSPIFIAAQEQSLVFLESFLEHSQHVDQTVFDRAIKYSKECGVY